MTPADRAAALSARIHREINAGRLSPGLDGRVAFLVEEVGGKWADLSLLMAGVSGTPGLRDPHARLGAELRAIALGNREGAR